MTGDRRRRYRVERGGRREEDRWGRSEVECRAVGGQRRLDRGEGKKGSVEGREERRGRAVRECGRDTVEETKPKRKTQKSTRARERPRKRGACKREARVRMTNPRNRRRCTQKDPRETVQERRAQASGAHKNDQPAQ